MRKGQPLLVPFQILAFRALACVSAQDTGLKTLAILFQAARLLAMAPLIVTAGIHLLSIVVNLWTESRWVALERRLDGSLPFFIILRVVVAALTVASKAVLPGSKAFAI